MTDKTDVIDNLVLRLLKREPAVTCHCPLMFCGDVIAELFKVKISKSPVRQLQIFSSFIAKLLVSGHVSPKFKFTFADFLNSQMNVENKFGSGK